jgi:DNA repair exonuclease SbcCD ATPase subunit
MSRASQAADDIKNLATKFRSLLTLAEALEAIGSIEQAERDAKSRKDKAVAEEAVSAQQLTLAVARLKTAEEKIADVDRNAAEIIRNAEDKAASIISEAKASASAISAESDKRVDAVKQDIVILRGSLQALQGKIDEKTAELANLTKAIEDAKSRVLSL